MEWINTFFDFGTKEFEKYPTQFVIFSLFVNYLVQSTSNYLPLLNQFDFKYLECHSPLIIVIIISNPFNKA